METSVDLKQLLLTPYHQVLHENEIYVYPNMAELKKAVKDSGAETGEENRIMDRMDDIVRNKLQNTASPHHGRFIDGVTEGTYLSIEANSSALTPLFSRIVSNSLKLEDVVETLSDYDILKETGEGFVWCEDCKKPSHKSRNSEACSYCSGKGSTEFHKVLTMPPEIMEEWIDGGDKFLEALAYRVIKDELDCDVFPRKDVQEEGRRGTLTEIDVIVPEKELCVLLTTSPSDSREKEQSKICKNKLGLDVVVATTNGNSGRMKYDKAFTSIDEDPDFGEKLRDYVRE
jgi:hypothetical protein